MDGAMRLRIGIVISLFAASGALAAQQAVTPPLGDVAREAEAAKATTKKATKVYTNSNLTADPTPPPAAPAAPASESGFVSKTTGKSVTADEIVTRSEDKVEKDTIAEQSESNWRARAESLRVQIKRLQDQMTAMTQPNAARDANPAARARYEADVARVQTGLDGLAKQWATLESGARYAKIKSEWLDPRPTF
jgi:hypothetical protein